MTSEGTAAKETTSATYQRLKITLWLFEPSDVLTIQRKLWNDITQSVAVHRIVSECHATFSKNKQMDNCVDITHDL